MAKKWDSDATPSDKLFMLFAILLFNNRAYSLTELMGDNYLNASKATVGRLIRKLERSKIGNLLREKRGREAFYKLEKPVHLPAISMNIDGLRQLSLCREFLTNLLPEKMSAEMQTSLSQAMNYMTHGHGQTYNIGSSLAKGRINYTPFQEILDNIIEAITHGKICKIEYKSACKNESREYEFAPKRILAYRECLYVDGWRVAGSNPVERIYDDALRLAVHRFKKCAILEKSSCTLPDTPYPDSKAMGVMQIEAFEVKIHFSLASSTYVAERQWSDEQTITYNEDGTVILTAQMANVPECISWILGFGESAVVLEPDWLIKEIKATLRKMIKNYKIPKTDLGQQR